jgi:hypothetical protein
MKKKKENWQEMMQKKSQKMKSPSEEMTGTNSKMDSAELESALMESVKVQPRISMLEEVIDLVGSKRNSEYGEPDENMERTAKLFSIYLGSRSGESITGVDIAMFGILLKIGRLIENPNSLDQWADIAGYSSIGYQIMKNSKKRG